MRKLWIRITNRVLYYYQRFAKPTTTMDEKGQFAQQRSAVFVRQKINHETHLIQKSTGKKSHLTECIKQGKAKGSLIDRVMTSKGVIVTKKAYKFPSVEALRPKK